MALMISPDSVHQALLPWFGDAFLAQGEDISASTAALLRNHPPYKKDFPSLYKSLDSHLFMAVYRQSKGTMTVSINGKLFRIQTDILPQIVDDMMGLYFFALPITPSYFDQIKEYSLTTHSLSALKALHLLYPSYQSQEENATIRRLIQSLFPPWRYESWLE